MGWPVPPDSWAQNTQDVWSWLILRAWEELIPGVQPDLVAESALVQASEFGWSGYWDDLIRRAGAYGGQTNAQRLVAILKNQGAILAALGTMATAQAANHTAVLAELAAIKAALPTTAHAVAPEEAHLPRPDSPQ